MLNKKCIAQAFVASLLSASLPLSSWAVECGDQSPTVTNGGSLHEEVDATTLDDQQRSSIAGLLKTFDGNWEGTGQAVFCLGTGANIRERVTNYTIDGDGQGSSTRGEIQLKMEHENGSVNERLRLVLDGNHLKLRDNFGDIKITSYSSNSLEYLHRYRTNQGRIPVELRWRISASGRGIQRRIIAEHWLYTPGGLGSTGIWKLRRD